MNSKTIFSEWCDENIHPEKPIELSDINKLCNALGFEEHLEVSSLCQLLNSNQTIRQGVFDLIAEEVRDNDELAQKLKRDLI